MLCLTFQLLTFLTNASSVALIAFRYWYARVFVGGYVLLTNFAYRIYRKQVLDIVGPQTTRHKAVFLLMIESGALYCGSWVSIPVVAQNILRFNFR